MKKTLVCIGIAVMLICFKLTMCSKKMKYFREVIG